MIEINVAQDFTDTPGGRLMKDGKFSGEEFREKLLIPKYKLAKENDDILVVNLDGCFGYPSSFLDESFGGLAVHEKSRDILKRILLICRDDPKAIEDIKQSVKDAVIEE